MHIEARGLVFDAADKPDSERIAFFTGLCRLQSGTLLCSFQVGSAKHAPNATIRLCRSDDGGNVWKPLPCRFQRTVDSVPGSLSAGALVEVEPGHLLLFATWFDRSEPDRPLFDPVSEGILHARQLMAISTDDGNSWTPWRDVPTPGLTGCATTGPVLSWSDGAIAHAFESFKEYDDPLPARHAAWLLVSRDGGLEFEPPFLVARHPQDALYYWDQRLCVGRQPGEFFALFWTHSRQSKKDLNVHFVRGSLHDGVKELPRATTIPGQIAAPLLLEDGRLLAFVVDRGRPGTMKLWQSTDEGATWPEAACLTVHVHEEKANLSQGRDNIDFAQYWEDMGKWSFGHPALCPLGNGRVLLAFYAGTPERMSIHWARVNTAP